MGVIFKKNKLTSFASETSLRFDYLFNNFVSKLSGDYYTYKELFEIIEYSKLDISDLSTLKYAEIGNVEKTGDVNPITLSFDDRNELNESLFKKIEKGDIIKPQKGDILISSIRPYLNKNVLINDEEIYFTKAFIQIRPKINSVIFYHTLRSVFFKNLNAVSRQGKGYPTLKEDDLKTIRFPKKIIDAIISNQELLIKKITPIEQEIKELKESKKDVLDIINDVFSKEFYFDWEASDNYLNNPYHKINFIKISNDELKFDISLKYRQAFELAKRKVKVELLNIGKIAQIKGGKRLPKGQNVIEDETEYKYVRVDDLNWDGTFNLNTIKYITKENHLKIKNYIAKENDILLTIVGATVGKCGLVPKDLDGENITENFARIIINNKKEILPQYFQYCLQSKVCQFQFDEYTGKASQGKLALFRIKKVQIPYIGFEKQTEIVEKIKSKIDAQKEIDNQIEEKQNEISELIENAISSKKGNK